MTEQAFFGLEPIYFEKLRKLLSKYQKVLIFGSRATGNFKKTSDIDLAIFDPISFREYLQFLTQIDDLELPYKVDLISFSEIKNPQLIAEIQQNGKDFL